MVSGYNVPGWGSGEALSCWVRMVAEARDENRDTRQGCGTASVPPLKSNRNVGKATWFSGSSLRPLPGACLLVSWLCGQPWPMAFCSGSVCLSSLVVCSWPCCVVWFRPPGLFLSMFLKEVTTQGNDPRTHLQAGIPSTCDSLGRGTGCWVFVTFFPYRFFLQLFHCTPSSRFRLTGRGQWKSLHVQSGLSVGVAPLYVSLVLPLSGVRVEEDVDQKLHSTVTVGTVFVGTVQSSHRPGLSTPVWISPSKLCVFTAAVLTMFKITRVTNLTIFWRRWRLVHTCRFVDQWAWIARGRPCHAEETSSQRDRLGWPRVVFFYVTNMEPRCSHLEIWIFHA